jgi:glycerol-3-phosphate dehydrogenase
VVLNAMDAQERGARILTRTKCISARREGDAWHAVLEHQHANGVQQEEARARSSTPPALGRALRAGVPQARTGRSLRLIKGSHIVVKRCSTTLRLHLPEPGQAHHLRHSLPGRVH